MFSKGQMGDRIKCPQDDRFQRGSVIAPCFHQRKFLNERCQVFFPKSSPTLLKSSFKFHFRKTRPIISSTMFVAGKYVPPHMRQRPAGLEAVPARAPGCNEPKRRNFSKKITKPKPVQVEAPKVEEPKVKPHCELFLADLPAPMRSVTTLAGKSKI